MISQSIASNWSSQQPRYSFHKQRKQSRLSRNEDSFLKRFVSLPRRIIGYILSEATGSIQFAASINESSQSPKKSYNTVSLYLEIEKCTDLRPLTIFGRQCCPIVVIKLDGKVIGETTPLRATLNPVWHDECFGIPMKNISSFGGPPIWISNLTLEVWHMGSDHEVGQCIGTTALQIMSILDSKPKTATTILSQNLTSLGAEMGSITYEVRGNTLQVKSPHEVQIVPRRLNRIASYCQRRLIKTGARNQIEVCNSNSFKIPNPDPLRRRDCLNSATLEQEQTMAESTMLKAFILVGIYLLFGIIGFSYIFENWSIRDSLYFCVVTFTTVGFGDIKPQTDGAKLFSCIFALAGIGIIGIALGYIGQNIVHARMATMHHVKTKLNERAGIEDIDLSCASVMDEEQSLEADICSNPSDKHLSDTGNIKLKTYRSINETFHSLLLATTDQPSLTNEIIMTIIPIVIMIFMGSVVVGRNEGWTVVDSIYWCISTGTSVGYGDFAPKTDEMRWFSIFFIPLSVGIISAALGRVANGFVEREIAKTNEKLLKSELTVEDLEKMNVDGDGEVSLLEFVEFMLKSMNKVDQKMLDDLHNQFYKLDADGSGALQEEDLELLASQKLAEQRRVALENFEKSKLFPVDHPS